MVADAPGLEEEAAHLRRLPRDAQGEGPRHRPGRHARPLARPADDRRRRGRRRRLRAEADQRRRGRGPGHARRRPQAQAGRAGRHPAPQHAAPDRGPRPDHQARASSARSAWSRSTATTTCGPAATRPTPTPPDEPRLRDVDRPGADAAVQPPASTRAAGGRSWSTATASSATCASTCSTWSAGCSTWAGRSGSARRAASWCDKESKANITDTQTATFDFGDLHVVWQHRTWGDPPDPKYPWGATFYGDKGTLKASVNGYDFIPARQGQADPPRRDVSSSSKYPEDKTEKDLEKHVAPAIRGHMKDFLAGDRHAAASRWPTSSRATSRRPAASWPTCRMQLGRTLTWDADEGSRSSATTRPTACSAGPTATRGSTQRQGTCKCASRAPELARALADPGPGFLRESLPLALRFRPGTRSGRSSRPGHGPSSSTRSRSRPRGGGWRPPSPASRPGCFPRTALKELTDAGFVVLGASQSRGPLDRVVSVEETYDFAMRLRILRRFHLLDAGRPSQFETYVNECFHAALLASVVSVWSAGPESGDTFPSALARRVTSGAIAGRAGSRSMPR